MPIRPNYGRWGSEIDDYYQRYRGALNEYSQAQMEGALAANRSAENDLYRYIGIQQQNMEREIKQRRMNALRTGATSAQLASQELQTMLAAQQGAQQVARDYMQQRQAIEGQFAGYQQGNEVRALEDYAYRMTQADNIQAQYDVARIQVDPSVAAVYIAESMGYDFESATEEEKLQFIDIATGVMEAQDFVPSSGGARASAYAEPFKGSSASYSGQGIPAGLADNILGLMRYAAGKDSKAGIELGAAQARGRGDWDAAVNMDPSGTRKYLEKEARRGSFSRFINRSDISREEAEELLRRYYGD